QTIHTESAHIVVVLHHEQHFAGPTLRHDHWSVDLCFDLAVVARQIDLDCRALADFAVELDVPTRLPHETVDLTQAETRSLTDGLRREERVERALEHILAHADARVADANEHVLTRNDFGIAEIGRAHV